MKRIAIITPCILPVPATRGGAVEGLITKILDKNEQNKRFIIDLFTAEDDGYTSSIEYSCANFLYIRKDKAIKLADKVLGRCCGMLPDGSANRLLNTGISDAFLKRLSENGGTYDALIVENMMDTAVDILKKCSGRYDFPVYFHMHNDLDIYRSPRHVRELVKYGVHFIAVSDYIKSRILKCDKKAVVSVLYNGVDVSEHDAGKVHDSNTVTFLYAGRVLPIKGVKELTKAFISFSKSLDKSDTTPRLEIYGFSGTDKSYEKELKDLAKAHDHISCHGQVPAGDMALVYDSADVVVMPSIVEEAFGQVALEAMSKRKALIVTDSGALPEVVGDGGLIVDRKGDLTGNLCDAMKRLFEDDSLRHELAERGYKRAHEVKEFDISNYYSNFAGIVDPEYDHNDNMVSVIVPVYNVSGYLKRCVTSITSQTCRNMEILLIDDGSTDSSGYICDALAKEDDRIRVIHQGNMGLSAARNTGLDNAKGSYIFFCDSDDYIRADAIELMLGKMLADQTDIVACGFSKVYGNDTENPGKEERFTSPIPGRWGGRESVIQMMRFNNVCSTAWNKLYRRELFEGIRFPLGVKNEDEATVYKLLYRAGIVSYTPETLYKYFQRDRSIMHEDLAGRYHFFLQASLDRIEYFRQLGEEELARHSRLSLLEWIKYSYRNIDDKDVRKVLLKTYGENVTVDNAPSVMGTRKRAALILWKYIRY